MYVATSASAPEQGRGATSRPPPTHNLSDRAAAAPARESGGRDRHGNSIAERPGRASPPLPRPVHAVPRPPFPAGSGRDERTVPRRDARVLPAPPARDRRRG